MKVYPSMRYHPEKDPVQVHSEEHDQALGPEWVHSPAEYGHETCPGVSPDPVIMAKGVAYQKKIASAKPSEPKKAPKSKKADASETGSA